MSTDPKTRGFSLTELMVVVGIIGIVLATSVPFIINWMRLYRLRAASQEVASELQTARMQAVMKTANRGVALVVVDSNSYRYVNYDLLASADANLAAQALGRLKTLPRDIVFDGATVAGGTPTSGVRFSRLGASCWDGSTNCLLTMPACIEAECGDDTTTATWMKGDSPNAGDATIGLRDLGNGLTRAVEIQLSGRVSER